RHDVSPKKLFGKRHFQAFYTGQQQNSVGASAPTTQEVPLLRLRSAVTLPLDFELAPTSGERFVYYNGRRSDPDAHPAYTVCKRSARRRPHVCRACESARTPGSCVSRGGGHHRADPAGDPATADPDCRAGRAIAATPQC